MVTGHAAAGMRQAGRAESPSVTTLWESDLHQGVFASNSLLLHNLQPSSREAQEGCNVVSVSGALCYCTLRWKTSQNVLPHQPSNYQQQECPFIPATFSLPAPPCASPSPCSYLPSAPSPLPTCCLFPFNLLSQQSTGFFASSRCFLMAPALHERRLAN